MAVKQKRIRCARCGERETVMRGERGPASIYCDLCRDEVKREQNALRAQAYRQRKASYGGGALNAPPQPGRGFRRGTKPCASSVANHLVVKEDCSCEGGLSMQPMIEFAQHVHTRISKSFRNLVEMLPDFALTWQPPASEANSVAQLVRHVATGQRHMLGLAEGEPPTITSMDPRERGLHNDPSTRAELLDLLARMDADREARLARLDKLDLGEAIPAGNDMTRFVWVGLSIGEAQEHLGHAELTAQLWQAQQ